MKICWFHHRQTSYGKKCVSPVSDFSYRRKRNNYWPCLFHNSINRHSSFSCAYIFQLLWSHLKTKYTMSQIKHKMIIQKPSDREWLVIKLNETQRWHQELRCLHTICFFKTFMIDTHRLISISINPIIMHSKSTRW